MTRTDANIVYIVRKCLIVFLNVPHKSFLRYFWRSVVDKWKTVNEEVQRIDDEELKQL